MDRILEGVSGKDNSDERDAPSLYHRVNIMKMAEQDREELMWLAKGVVSEREKIRKFSTGDYLELLKYTIEQSEKNV